MTRPTDMNKADKLKAAADAAAEVRAYQTDPDVVALRVERVRGWVDRLIWTGMVLGLLFTMANVAHFAAAGAAMWSLVWVTAWLLDPMVSLVLIGVLMGEQIINRHGLDAGGWVRTTKWVALGCTYCMNTWSSWASLDPAAILLHSVPPAIVFCAAEAVVTIRQRITDAVNVAHRQAADRAAALRATEAAAEAPAEPQVQPSPRIPEHAEQLREPARRPALRTTQGSAQPSARGRDRTRTTSRTDGEAAVDRDALVAELAAEILTAAAAGEKWRPTIRGARGLMERTGQGERWCQYVVRDAKNAALSTRTDTPDEDPQSDLASTGDDTPHGPRAERPQSARADHSGNDTVDSPDGDTQDSAPARTSGGLALARTDGGER